MVLLDSDVARDLRKHLWKNHGHPGHCLYLGGSKGDAGMFCLRCDQLNYAHAPLEVVIRTAIEKLRRQRVELSSL